VELIFSENKSFYNQLDIAIKKGGAIVVFRNEKPDEKSKLWARLKRCKNWSMVEAELEKVKDKKDSVVERVMSPSMAGALAGGEIILIAWIATLLAGLLFYGIYKECNIKFRANKNGEIDIEIDNLGM